MHLLVDSSITLLKPAINGSDSADIAEKKYWEVNLPNMNFDDKVKLFSSLVNDEIYSNRGITTDTNEEYKATLNSLYEYAKKSNETEDLLQWAGILSESGFSNDLAKEIYLKTIKLNPKNSKVNFRFANFLKENKNIKEAEKYYQATIRFAPKDTLYMEQYIDFLNETSSDIEKIKYLYEKALRSTANNINILESYAYFLFKTEKNYDNSELKYKMAIKLSKNNKQDNYRIQNNYALFLYTARKEYTKAEKIFKKSIKNDAISTESLGNYAQLKLIQGKSEEGEVLLNRSFEMNSGSNKILDLEIWFYRYCHFPSKYQEAIGYIDSLLTEGVRSKNWDFSENIKRAAKEKHSDLKNLKLIASIISNFIDHEEYLSNRVTSDRKKREEDLKNLIENAIFLENDERRKQSWLESIPFLRDDLLNSLVSAVARENIRYIKGYRSITGKLDRYSLLDNSIKNITTLGMNFELDNKDFLVKNIIPRSISDKAGVHKGDKIINFFELKSALSIEGLKTDSFELKVKRKDKNIFIKIPLN